MGKFKSNQCTIIMGVASLGSVFGSHIVWLVHMAKSQKC